MLAILSITSLSCTSMECESFDTDTEKESRSEGSSNRDFFKILHGVHLFITILLLTVSVYHAVEMRNVHAKLEDLKAFKDTFSRKSFDVEHSKVPQTKNKVDMFEDGRKQVHSTIDVNETGFKPMRLKNRVQREAFRGNDSCIERIQKLVQLLMVSDEQARLMIF